MNVLKEAWASHPVMFSIGFFSPAAGGAGRKLIEGLRDANGMRPDAGGGIRVRVVFRSGSLPRTAECACYFEKKMNAESLTMIRRTEEPGGDPG